MSKETYYDRDGKSYVRIINQEIEIPPQPKTLEEAIQRIKDMCEFEEDKAQMYMMIEKLKEDWGKDV
jgi:hypothetical protein